MSDEIVNKVADSGLISMDLSSMKVQGERAVVDLKDRLWEEIALKEKDFRASVRETDWSEYEGKHVAVTCSVDAIIPTWAYMLIGSALKPYAASVCYGTAEELEDQLYEQLVRELPLEDYRDGRVIVKGCGDVPTSAYVILVDRLQPVVKSLMFGEPCSTVPIYKRPK